MDLGRQFRHVAMFGGLTAMAYHIPLQSLPLEGIRTRKSSEYPDIINCHLYSLGTNDFQKMTLQEAQQAVDQWIKTYGVRYFSELTNMTVLTEEVGELARVIARKYGDQSWKASDPRSADNGQAALGEEMADVLWVLLCLANQTGVDLTEELKKSIEKKTKRDANRHINNEKLKQ